MSSIAEIVSQQATPGTMLLAAGATLAVAGVVFVAIKVGSCFCRIKDDVDTLMILGRAARSGKPLNEMVQDMQNEVKAKLAPEQIKQADDAVASAFADFKFP